MDIVRRGSAAPTVVLVHGAFADASGFAGVIRELQSAHVPVRTAAVPLRGLAFDADALSAYVAGLDGPVVLVGHSYGGAVITQAAAALDHVVGLVYLAGFGLDLDESVASVQEPFAPPLLATSARATAYDARGGAVGGPDLYIDDEAFRETFCADVPAALAAVMAVTQRPVAAAAIAEKCTSAGWKTRPTSYLVSTQDRAISPDAERFMADRMGATREDIDASHVAFISKPAETAAFLLSALHRLV
jgi:pimeloyl-ACP methyl ester carboxylesterase